MLAQTRGDGGKGVEFGNRFPQSQWLCGGPGRPIGRESKLRPGYTLDFRSRVQRVGERGLGVLIEREGRFGDVISVTLEFVFFRRS